MVINNNYVVVKKLEEEKKEGFQTVDVVDSSVYKGVIVSLPEVPIYIGNKQLDFDDVILFAKYSPDTHEVTEEGVTVKFIKITDILKVY